MSCSACEAAVLHTTYGTKTTAPAHHTTKTQSVTGLRCPPPNLLVALLQVPSTTQPTPPISTLDNYSYRNYDPW